MCLAEALLRIPDAETADALMRDKIGSGRWGDAPGDGSLFVNAADWALMLTGTLARWARRAGRRTWRRASGASSRGSASR